MLYRGVGKINFQMLISFANTSPICFPKLTYNAELLASNGRCSLKVWHSTKAALRKRTINTDFCLLSLHKPK